jgi:hypothetical protein
MVDEPNAETGGFRGSIIGRPGVATDQIHLQDSATAGVGFSGGFSEPWFQGAGTAPSFLQANVFAESSFLQANAPVVQTILNPLDAETIEALARLVPLTQQFVTGVGSDEEKLRQLVASEVADQFRSVALPALDQIGQQQGELKELFATVSEQLANAAASPSTAETEPSPEVVVKWSAVAALWVASFLAGVWLHEDHTVGSIFVVLAGLLALWDRCFNK